MPKNPATDADRPSRRVVLQHEDSIPCVIFRPVFPGEDGVPNTAGDLPILGDVDAADSGDEDDHDWIVIGFGLVLFTGASEGGEIDPDAVELPPAAALIELTEDASGRAFDTSGEIPAAQMQDAVFVCFGAGVRMPYEVVDVANVVIIPETTRTYMLSPRDEWDWMDEETAHP